MKKLVDVSRLAYSKGLVNTYEGNLSQAQDGVIYITPSNTCKGILTEEMIVVTDMNGAVLRESKSRPSTEIKLHLAVYMDRSDIKAIIHSHAPFLTAYAVANKSVETRAYPN